MHAETRAEEQTHQQCEALLDCFMKMKVFACAKKLVKRKAKLLFLRKLKKVFFFFFFLLHPIQHEMFIQNEAKSFWKTSQILWCCLELEFESFVSASERDRGGPSVGDSCL